MINITWQRQLDEIIGWCDSANAGELVGGEKLWVYIRIPWHDGIPIKFSIEDAQDLLNAIEGYAENLVASAEENPLEYNHYMAEFYRFNLEIGPKLLELRSYIRKCKP